MDGLILLMSQKMPVSHIATLLEEHDTRIWRVIEHYVDEAGTMRIIPLFQR